MSMEAACSRARMQPLESKSGFSDRAWRRHLRGSLRPGRPLLSCPTSALWAGARTALGSGAGGGALDLDHRSVEESLAADVLNHYVGPVDARFASPLSGLLSTLIPSSAAIRDYGEPQVNSPWGRHVAPLSAAPVETCENRKGLAGHGQGTVY